MKISKKDLAANYESRDTECIYTAFALQAVMNGEVEWVKEGKYRAGIVRPDSASGGVVIVQEKDSGTVKSGYGFPRVYGLESWVQGATKHADALLGFNSGTGFWTDGNALRELARRVMNLRNELANRLDLVGK